MVGTSKRRRSVSWIQKSRWVALILLCSPFPHPSHRWSCSPFPHLPSASPSSNRSNSDQPFLVIHWLPSVVGGTKQPVWNKWDICNRNGDKFTGGIPGLKCSTRLVRPPFLSRPSWARPTLSIYTLLVHFVQHSCVSGWVTKCHISFTSKQRRGWHQYDKTYTRGQTEHQIYWALQCPYLLWYFWFAKCDSWT